MTSSSIYPKHPERHRTRITGERTLSNSKSVLTSYRIECLKPGCTWLEKAPTILLAQQRGQKHEQGLAR